MRKIFFVFPFFCISIFPNAQCEAHPPFTLQIEPVAAPFPEFILSHPRNAEPSGSSRGKHDLHRTNFFCNRSAHPSNHQPDFQRM